MQLPYQDKVKIFLVYQEGDEKPMYLYDIQSSTLLRSGAIAEDVYDSRILFNNFPISASVVATFLGGVTGGYSFKEFIALKNKEDPRIVAAILGSVSGFWLGYKCATSIHWAFTRTDVIKKLEDVDAWKVYARKLVRYVVAASADSSDSKYTLELYEKLYASGEDDNRKRQPLLSQNNADEELLDNIKAISKSDEYYRHAYEEPIWMRWWFVSACLAAIVVALLVFLIVRPALALKRTARSYDLSQNKTGKKEG